MINKLWQIVNIYLELKTGGFEKKKHFDPCFFSIVFKKKNVFFFLKTERFFYQENTRHISQIPEDNFSPKKYKIK